MSECIKPLRNKVVVKPSPIKEKTDEDIYRADSKEKPVEGVVTAVGSGILTLDGISVPLEVSVGDTVPYSNCPNCGYPKRQQSYGLYFKGQICSYCKYLDKEAESEIKILDIEKDARVKYLKENKPIFKKI